MLLKVPCSPERNLWASRDHLTLFGAIHLSSKFANSPTSAKVKVLNLFVDSVPSSHFQEEIGTKNLFLDNFAQHLCCLTSLCPEYLAQILRWGFSPGRGRQFAEGCSFSVCDSTCLPVNGRRKGEDTG